MLLGAQKDSLQADAESLVWKVLQRLQQCPETIINLARYTRYILSWSFHFWRWLDHFWLFISAGQAGQDFFLSPLVFLPQTWMWTPHHLHSCSSASFDSRYSIFEHKTLFWLDDVVLAFFGQSVVYCLEREQVYVWRRLSPSSRYSWIISQH